MQWVEYAREHAVHFKAWVQFPLSTKSDTIKPVVLNTPVLSHRRMDPSLDWRSLTLCWSGRPTRPSSFLRRRDAMLSARDRARQASTNGNIEIDAVNAHAHSIDHRDLLAESEASGCSYCLAIFTRDAIAE